MKRRVITASDLDEISANYGRERTRDIAKRLGLDVSTVSRIAREECGMRMTSAQRGRAIARGIWRGMR